MLGKAALCFRKFSLCRKALMKMGVRSWKSLGLISRHGTTFKLSRQTKLRTDYMSMKSQTSTTGNNSILEGSFPVAVMRKPPT